MLRILALVLTCLSLTAAAQKTKLEQVKEECKDMPLDKRTVIAVSSFGSLVNNDNFKPDGLVDMLSNALFNTGCFNVLERKNFQEINQELNMSNSSGFDAKSAVKLGKLKGASLLIMGNITEFQEGTEGAGVGGLFGKVVAGVGSVTAHLGIIIKVIDTRTGMVLDSKSFNKKITKTGMLGGGLAGNAAVGGGFWKSKAMQDAAEQTIIDIVGYITKSKTAILNSSQLQSPASGSTMELVVNALSYEQVQKIAAHLGANASIKNISKTYKNKAANYTFETTLDSEKVLEYITSCKCGFSFEVQGVEDSRIELKVK